MQRLAFLAKLVRRMWRWNTASDRASRGTFGRFAATSRSWVLGQHSKHRETVTADKDVAQENLGTRNTRSSPSYSRPVGTNRHGFLNALGNVLLPMRLAERKCGKEGVASTQPHRLDTRGGGNGWLWRRVVRGGEASTVPDGPRAMWHGALTRSDKRPAADASVDPSA